MRSHTVAVIVEQRHLDKPALTEACVALEAAGCDVPLIVPDARRLHVIRDDAPEWDAVLSRGRNLVGLGLLASAAARGVLAINSPRAIELCRNKIAMHSLLVEHGLPLPRTWFAADPAVFARVPRENFPLVVKPFDGDGSAGISLLERPEDVALLPRSGGGVFLAQELLETDGVDLKLYGIGRRVWAVRKPAPVVFEHPGPATAVDGGHAAAEPVALTPELEDIARTSGRALGLELWGVDVALTPRGPVVIEVNDFPTYSAVAGAGAAIAEHVLRLVELDELVRGAGRPRALALVQEAR